MWVGKFLVDGGVFSIVPPPFEFGTIVGRFLGGGADEQRRRDVRRAVWVRRHGGAVF
jgi:hypothetical protein